MFNEYDQQVTQMENIQYPEIEESIITPDGKNDSLTEPGLITQFAKTAIKVRNINLLNLFHHSNDPVVKKRNCPMISSNFCIILLVLIFVLCILLIYRTFLKEKFKNKNRRTLIEV